MNNNCDLFSDNQERLEHLQSYFKTAEKHLKIVERKKIILGSELAGPGITVIDALSSAAYFTIEALVEKDSLEQKKLLEKALDCCGNAGFEALKMSIMDMLREVDRFRKAYKNDIIADSFPDWIARFCDAKKVVEELNRIKNSGEIGRAYYEYVRNENKKILALVEDIQIYEPILREKRRRRLLGDRAFKVWLICGIISLILHFIMMLINPTVV